MGRDEVGLLTVQRISPWSSEGVGHLPSLSTRPLAKFNIESLPVSARNFLNLAQAQAAVREPVST